MHAKAVSLFALTRSHSGLGHLSGGGDAARPKGGISSKSPAWRAACGKIRPGRRHVKKSVLAQKGGESTKRSMGGYSGHCLQRCGRCGRGCPAMILNAGRDAILAFMGVDLDTDRHPQGRRRPRVLLTAFDGVGALLYVIEQRFGSHWRRSIRL